MKGSSFYLYLPGGSKLELPPAERLRVELRLLRPARFRFLHGGILHGLLCRVFGHPLPAQLIPWTPESGRVFYQPGESWVFGLTAAGEARSRLAGLAPALERLGALKPLAGDGPPPTLDGNFEVVGIESLGPLALEKVAARAAELAESGTARLRFLSPLRLRREQEEGGDKTERSEDLKAFLGNDFFSPELFLDRALRRFLLLRDGQFPPARSLPPPPRPRLAASRLAWVDLPMRGPREGKKGRPQGTTLGGVLGEVRLAEVSAEAAALLAALEPFHAGSSTHFGFGRYCLGELEESDRPSPRERPLDVEAAAASLLEGSPKLRQLRAGHGREALEAARREGYESAWGVDREVLSRALEVEVRQRLADFFPAEAAAGAPGPGLALLLPDLAAEAAKAGARLIRLGADWVLLERAGGAPLRPELRAALGPLPLVTLLGG